MAALFQTPDVPSILQIDCLASEAFPPPAYPTHLLYNPYAVAQQVTINVGLSTNHLYDAVAGVFGYSGNLVGRNPKRRLLERKSMESAAWVVSWQGGLRFVSEMRQVALCRTFALVGAGV